MDIMQWTQILLPAISAGTGGIVTAILQQKVVASSAGKAVRRQKLEEIANLSVDAEQYAFAEQSLNSFQAQMIAMARRVGGNSDKLKLPEWVRISEEKPHKTPQLENLVRTFLPSQSEGVNAIRRIEVELQQKFAIIFSDVRQADPSSIDVFHVGLRCLNETPDLIEKLKIRHDGLRNAASIEEQIYI